MHDTLLDPSEKYLIMSDLGADRVRVFNWDKETLTPMTELASLITDPGTGPHHGVVWTSPEGGLFYVFVGELRQLVCRYQVVYLEGEKGLSWEKIDEIPALGWEGRKPILTAPPSEIALTLRPNHFSFPSLPLSPIPSRKPHLTNPHLTARQPLPHNLQPGHLLLRLDPIPLRPNRHPLDLHPPPQRNTFSPLSRSFGGLSTTTIRKQQSRR